MAITKGFRVLVDQAMAEVKTYSVAEVLAKSADANVQIVDIRDVRELRNGTVTGSYHAPRCMLEFWVDPESPYHKKIWADDSKEFILFCGAARAARHRLRTTRSAAAPRGHRRLAAPGS